MWPPTDERFDEEEAFSYKLYNIRGYMSEVINKIEAELLMQKKQIRETLEGRGIEREEMRDRKRSMAHMACLPNPDKGSEHIHIGSATLKLYEQVQTEETEI